MALQSDGRGILDFGSGVYRFTSALFGKVTDAGDTAIKASADGALKVSLADALSASIDSISIEGTKATYSAGIGAFTGSAASADFFVIQGSATKTVRVRRIIVSGFADTPDIIQLLVVRRSTTNTGGTPTVLTNVSHDSTNAAATAVVAVYAAAPTQGTLVGAIRGYQLSLGAPAGPAHQLVIEAGDVGGQSFVLRGTGELLTLNLNGATALSTLAPGHNLAIYIEWTEE
jgi:hypothetical protein